jgi:hypothetical protein
MNGGWQFRMWNSPFSNVELTTIWQIGEMDEFEQS